MRIDFITPFDIMHSSTGTERVIYGTAKFLKSKGFDVRILVSSCNDGTRPYVKNYKQIAAKYKDIPQEPVQCSLMELPFNYKLFSYNGLDKDSLIYFPYGVYEYIWNISNKPKGQKYIIACHGMHLKNGRIIKGHHMLEGMLNSMVRSVLSRPDIAKNVYFNAINREQISYLAGLGVKRSNIIWVPPYIESNLFKVGTNSDKRLRIVHIGGTAKRAEAVLGVIETLETSKRLRDYDFYFIGRDEPDGLLAAAKRLKNVHCLGGINDAEKAKLLARMDAMITPAVEIFPMSVLDGLASGLQIATSTMNPASTDLKMMGASVYVTDNGTPEEYIAVLKKIAGKKKNLKAFNRTKTKNRELVVKNFDKSVVFQKALDMFEYVMNR